MFIVRSHLDSAVDQQLRYSNRLEEIMAGAVGVLCSDAKVAEARVWDLVRDAFHCMSAEDALRRWDVAVAAMQAAQDALVAAVTAADDYEKAFGSSVGVFSCTDPLYIDVSLWTREQLPAYRGRKLPYSYIIDVFLHALHKFEVRNKSRVLSGGVRELVKQILKKVMWMSKLSLNRFKRRVIARSECGVGPVEVGAEGGVDGRPLVGWEATDAARCAHLLEEMEGRFRLV
jgi:hypothetical protein